jgi:S1-C subfamily serine protease
MKKFIGGAVALVALAAVISAAMIAAAMFSARPVAAQARPNVLVRALGTTSIGVTIRDVTSEDAAKAKMAQAGGVYVESVREGTPAARAGSQSGDIVIDFDGERVRSATHFTRLVQESAPNRQVAAVVVRGTSKQTVNVVPESANRINDLLSGGRGRALENLQREPRNFNFNFDADALRRALPLGGGGLGVTVAPLTDQLAGYFGVKEGVLVTGVTSNSPAAEAGLRAGDVITAINGQNVTGSADVTRALRQRRSEGTLDIAVTRDKKSLSLKATIPDRSRTPSGRSGLPI